MGDNYQEIKCLSKITLYVIGIKPIDDNTIEIMLEGGVIVVVKTSDIAEFKTRTVIIDGNLASEQESIVTSFKMIKKDEIKNHNGEENKCIKLKKI